MKSSLALLVLMAISSCSNNQVKPYSNETHCSSEALLHMKSYPLTPGLEKFHEAVNTQAQACNKEQFMDKEYAICTVVQTDSKGKISFLDVQDKNTKFSSGLHKCLTDSIERGDFSMYPDSTIVEPVIFHVKRRD